MTCYCQIVWRLQQTSVAAQCDGGDIMREPVSICSLVLDWARTSYRSPALVYVDTAVVTPRN